jgi:hypothetical protein
MVSWLSESGRGNSQLGVKERVRMRAGAWVYLCGLAVGVEALRTELVDGVDDVTANLRHHLAEQVVPVAKHDCWVFSLPSSPRSILSSDSHLSLNSSTRDYRDRSTQRVRALTPRACTQSEGPSVRSREAPPPAG